MEILPKLVVGLGNPGPDYYHTRHNAGFMTVDRVVEIGGPPIKEYERHDSKLTEIRIGGRQIMLAKPQTIMNLSGRAVRRAQKSLGLEPEEIFIIYDCLDLPLGRIRLRLSGGSGGHKGMESIIQALGTNKMPRLRIGIGSAVQTVDVVQHVLSAWDKTEWPLVRETIDSAADAVITALRRGVTAAMNAFNSWTPQTENRAEQ